MKQCRENDKTDKKKLTTAKLEQVKILN